MKKKHQRRLKQAEASVAYLKRSNARLDRELHEVREQSRRNDVVIRGALVPWLTDIVNGVMDGSVTFTVENRYDDTVPGLRVKQDWHCKYESSARTMVDGRDEYRSDST